MNLIRHISVSVNGMTAQVFGGPYREYIPGTRRLVGIKMAEEIDHACHIDIPTRDFSVPSIPSIQAGIIRAVDAILQGNDLYVGCMGGTGRTGLFMACLVKALNDYHTPTEEAAVSVPSNPIRFVRANYKPHAVETDEQVQFVNNFDTAPIVEYIAQTLDNRVYIEVPVAVERIVKEEVVIVKYPSIKAYILWLLWGTKAK